MPTEGYQNILFLIVIISFGGVYVVVPFRGPMGLKNKQ